MDRWIRYKKCDDFRVAAPSSVLDLVEIKSIAENGIFEVGKGGIFTKTYMFSDINYSKAGEDAQLDILLGWCRFLNSQSAPFKITINNKNKNMNTLKDEVMFFHTEDGYDDYRDEFNSEIEDKILNGRMGIEQEMYITVRYELTSSYEDAKNYFMTLEAGMVQSFKNIGSRLMPLNATERLRILHDFYRFGNEEYFDFDFKKAVENRFDFKDAIICSMLDFSEEKYFRSDDKYVSALYLKQLPGTLSDRILTDLARLDVKMMVSVDIAPISDKDCDDELDGIYRGIERRISKQTKNRVKRMDFNSDISLPVTMAKSDIEEMIKGKKEDDQHFFYAMVNILVISDSLEDLKKDVNLIILTAKSKSVVIDYNYMMQREALNTVLPIGVRQVRNGRALRTKSLAALFPFNVSELHMPGGFWYGINSVSKALLYVNRKSLINPHGFIFGVTGSGKTAAGKLEMMQTLLKTPDDVIVIDPKNDYEELTLSFGGSYIDVSGVSDTMFNPLDYYNNGDRINVADEKAELTLAICENCKRSPLTAKERSLINRGLKLVFSSGPSVVTLTDIYNIMDVFSEPEAEDIKLYLELFVSGSLDIFSKPSNVNINNRFIGFGLKKLGTELRPLAMLVMCEWIKERILYNAACGRATRLFIDEFHEILRTEYTKTYINSLWMLVRSLGGIITGLTQNVSSILVDDSTRALLENSEFMMILKQNKAAADVLTDELGIPPEMVDEVTSQSHPGAGILSCGQVTVPFDMQIRKNTRLYSIINTSFHDRQG